MKHLKVFGNLLHVVDVQKVDLALFACSHSVTEALHALPADLPDSREILALAG